MSNRIGWGILATGGIAQKFAEDLVRLPDAELVAVGSRARAAADDFGARFGAKRCYGSYQDVVDDPEVDVVYVATPHTLHQDNASRALAAGKAVLCEKPLTLNATEARALIAQAREAGVFLMEAVWMRFFPVLDELRRLLAEEALGKPHTLCADFGIQPRYDPKGRLFDPALGGGALLDLGVYPLSLASLVFGRSERVASLAHRGETGVDEQAGIVLGYADGALATLYTSFHADTPIEAVLSGERGRIKLHRPFHHPTRLTLALAGESEQVFERAHEGHGYQFEAQAVMDCLRAGKTECERMPLDESLAIVETMDQIRSQWGLQYPGE